MMRKIFYAGIVFLCIAGCKSNKCTVNGRTYDTCYEVNRGELFEYYVSGKDTFMEGSGLPAPPTPPPPPTDSSGVVDIKDVRQTQVPTPDEAHHKYHDVEVYRAKSGDAESYRFYYYRKESDTIKCYKNALSMKSKPDMDKAEYKWVNDTLAKIRLYNSVSKKEIFLEVYGNGEKSGIGMTEKEVNRTSK